MLPIPHLLGIEPLAPHQITALLDQAEQIVQNGIPATHPLTGLTQAHLFETDHPATGHLFSEASKRLSTNPCQVDIDLTPQITLSAMAEAISQTDPDLLIMRHTQPGAVLQLSERLGIPVLNAGDGTHENPIAALATGLTLRRAKSRLHRLSIAILGDIARHPGALSLIMLLGKLENRVRLIAPPAMLPAGIDAFGLEVFTDLTQGLHDTDAVIVLPPEQGQLAQPQDYLHHYGLTQSALAAAKEDVTLIAPNALTTNTPLPGCIAAELTTTALDPAAHALAACMAALIHLTQTAAYEAYV